MKRLYISCGLIVLLAVLSAVHTIYLSQFTGQLTSQLQQAQAQVELEDWAGAAQLTRQAKEQWEDRRWYLHTTLHHEDIDAILLSFDETLAYLEGEERQPAEYAAANARLIGQIGLLLEAELPTLTNLL